MNSKKSSISKGGVALDWILSSLIFLSVLFFVVFSFISSYHNFFPLKNEGYDALLLCKERYLLYEPLCDNLFVILDEPLYSSTFPIYTYKYKGKNFYLVYANSSQEYSVRECTSSAESDIVYSDIYINNSVISFNLINDSLIYANEEILKIYNSTYIYENQRIKGYGVLVNSRSDDKILFLPFAPQIIIFSRDILLNISKSFNYLYHNGGLIYINGTGKIYEDIVSDFCLRTSPEICIDSDSYMEVKIYNYTSGISIEIIPYALFTNILVGSIYEKCMNKNIFQPIGFYYIYNNTCLISLRNGMSSDIEVQEYDGCGNINKKIL